MSREVLSFSRELEFATPAELAKRMGCARHLWLRAAVKELTDNCLDACEEAGVEPSITITIDNKTLTVGDNGPGLATELVEQLCVRSERTSSREAYAAPDRGAMGNAIQTLMALPFGFGRDEAVTTITSRGVEHTVTLRVNRLAGRIDLERAVRAVPDTPGTIVALAWPAPIDRNEVLALVAQQAWLNPHAAFDVNGGYWCAEPTAAVAKWTPNRPTPINWYSLERFGHRILLEMRHNPAVTVAQFIGVFAGLSSRSKRALIAELAGLQYQRLEALLDASGTRLNPAPTQMLLEAMLAESRAPKHAVLGAVGRATFEDWVTNHGSALASEPQFLAYTILDGVVQDAIPYRWEVGIAHLPGVTERGLLVGQNFSPAILPERMADEVLDYAGRYFGADRPIALMLHRITPARQTLDYGKSNLGLGWSEIAEVCHALAKIGQRWIKHATALDQGKRTPPAPKSEKLATFQDAVFAAMAVAYDEASSYGAYPVLSQQVFYKARPKILEMTGKEELKPGERSRFCYVLLPQFTQANPKLTAGWRILYKPRGELIEPHTGLRIGLGTSEVARYCAGWINGEAQAGIGVEAPAWEPETCGPHRRYGGELVVEKGGIADVLRALEVGTKHDLAIVGNEGQSPEAELRLVDAFGGFDADLPIFLLTDFDRQGLTIAENLRSGTWRHRYRNKAKVIHIGLRFDQIDELGGLASEKPGGLEDEPIGEKARNHVGDARLRECGASEAEIKVLRTRRVELNALSTKQLVVELVEPALAKHGVGKVVPSAEALAAAWRSAKAHAEIAAAIEKANTRAAKRWQNAEPPGDLADRIRAILEANPAASWDAALRLIAEDDAT